MYFKSFSFYFKLYLNCKFYLKKSFLIFIIGIMRKCNRLWAKSKRPSAAEKIFVSLGIKSLRVPCVTRWNSLHRALAQLIEHEENLPILFDRLNLGNEKLTDSDMKYVKILQSILEPLSEAIDILQGEYNIYYG